MTQPCNPNKFAMIHLVFPASSYCRRTIKLLQRLSGGIPTCVSCAYCRKIRGRLGTGRRIFRTGGANTDGKPDQACSYCILMCNAVGCGHHSRTYLTLSFEHLLPLMDSAIDIINILRLLFTQSNATKKKPDFAKKR